MDGLNTLREFAHKGAAALNDKFFRSSGSGFNDSDVSMGSLMTRGDSRELVSESGSEAKESLAKSRRIETVERSLEGENIIARSAIESGTLLTRWNLQGLLFFVGHESQNELQPSVF